MEKYLVNLIKAILAGLAICIGAILFINVGGGPIGALFFAIGIYLVLWYNLNLYTGKIGYLSSYKEVPNILLMIIGNFIGTSLILLVPCGGAFVQTLIIGKMA